MKPSIVILLMLLVVTGLAGQTSRMNNAETGRTYSVEHRGQTNLLLLQQAEMNYRNFEYESTLFALENAVAQNPYSAEALILRARFKKRMGMQSEAEADFQMANRLNPYAAKLYGFNGNSGLLTMLSIQPERTFQSLGTYQKLHYYYDFLDTKAIQNQAEEIVLLENVIAEIESDNLETAHTMIEELLANFPESAIAQDLNGLVYMKQGNYEMAVKCFSKAVALQPNFAIAWYNFAQVERKLGNLKNAKVYLDRSINLQEDLTKAYFERAMVLKTMGDKENALKDYNSVIEMKGNDYMEAFLNRGLTKKMLGDYGGALADLNRAIEEYPDNSALIKNRGNLHMLFGQHRNAIDDYTKAIQLNEEYAEAYYNRALAHFLIFDKVSGCFDLEKSAAFGFEKAEEAQVYFCGW